MKMVFTGLGAPMTLELPKFLKQGQNWVMYKVPIKINPQTHTYDLFIAFLQNSEKDFYIQDLRKKFEYFMPVPKGYMVTSDLSKDPVPKIEKDNAAEKLDVTQETEKEFAEMED